MTSPRIALLLSSVVLLQACTKDSNAETVQAAPQQQVRSTPANDPTTRFVAHADHIQPGAVQSFAGMRMVNPHEGNAAAIANGAKLFIAYNCIDCHGADGSGAMGPSLADGRWHFGGGVGEVFESIYQGRPEGMPAWGSLISDDQIWMLVSYVRSLNAGKDVTTENFGGKTVERSGH
jgi:cytochrome c oxidase cbb3-type subunit III